jgi:hypothetical protein
VKALFIPVDGPPRELDLPDGGTRFMRSLKALIGTECAERIRVTSRWEAWLDEDGAATGKLVNQAATLVAQSFGFEQEQEHEGERLALTPEDLGLRITYLASALGTEEPYRDMALPFAVAR